MAAAVSRPVCGGRALADAGGLRLVFAPRAGHDALPRTGANTGGSRGHAGEALQEGCWSPDPLPAADR